MAFVKRIKELTLPKKIGLLAIVGGVVAVLIIAFSIPPAAPPSSPIPPGSFTLMSTAGSPETDGTFTLSWTSATEADSYTVYEHSSPITTINGSVASLGTTTDMSRMVSGRKAGTYYYAVRATNADGTSTSNCVAVTSTWRSWTWMGGNCTTGVNGIYGIKGSPSSKNWPGSRYLLVSWTDNVGNFWLFGGVGYGASGGVGQLNDMWRLNTTSFEWTHVSGSDSTLSSGVYGTMGSAAPGNTPGARSECMSWKDPSGNLWLFGGSGRDGIGGSGFLNDLWRFNTTSLMWTWMNGSDAVGQYGVYGTMGQPANPNTPAGRTSAAAWACEDGTLWLFGGYGLGSSGSAGQLNDLWRFNTNTRQWTWMNGSSSTNQQGVYGIKNQPASANTPGARYYPYAWTGANNLLWLYGGSNGANSFNDLWRFNRTSNQWAWMGGSNTTMNLAPVYGTMDQPDNANTPGSRDEGSTWVGAGGGELWLYGGYAHNASAYGYCNDLWRYDVATSQWTWISGDNVFDQLGVYGTPGQPAATNIPGAREYTITFTGALGELWVFGGDGYGMSGGTSYLNDLWRFYP